jgi:hypothetical protein
MSNQSFNIKDLINDEDLSKYSDLINNLDLNNLNLNNLNLDKSEKIINDKEEIRRKLREKTNSLRNNRLGKKTKEDNQIKALKENPMFQNIDSNSDMKGVIDKMASNMSNDPRQKKNIKKQIEKLVDKIKQPEI